MRLAVNGVSWIRDRHRTLWIASCVALALLVCACAAGHEGAQPNVEGKSNTPSESSDARVAEDLIDELTRAAPETERRCISLAGGCFLPFAKGTSESSTGHLMLSSPPLRALVEMGVEAVPTLLQHLDDSRLTPFDRPPLADNPSVIHRYKELTVELDPLDRRSIALLAEEVKAMPPARDASNHQLMVGDVCFFALGQILNRYYLPYQPVTKYVMIVTSPLEFPELTASLRRQWAEVSETSHKTQLAQDLKAHGTSRFREDAWLRTQFYYPNDAQAHALDVIRAERGLENRWHALATLIGSIKSEATDELRDEIENTLTNLTPATHGHEYLGLTCVDFLIDIQAGLDTARQYCEAMTRTHSANAGYQARLEKIDKLQR